ncbi:MAG: alkaline phosphatase family protein [Chloroflexota bacterium]
MFTRARRRSTVLLALIAAFAVVGSWRGPATLHAQSTVLAPNSHRSMAGVGARAQRTGPFALVLVVDAGRADEFDLSTMPNLARLVSGGTAYTNAWVGQLPSITETSHATIGTGVLPKRHLILGDTWRIPGTNQMSPNLLNGTLTRTGYIGKVIRQSGVPTLAGFVHARFPGSRVVALSGHKIYAADGLGAGSADYVAFGAKNSRGHYVPQAIPGHEPAPSILSSPQLDLPTYPRKPGLEDEWTTTLALKFLFKYHPRLMMINLPEVDTFGHLDGTDSTVIQPLMANVDHEIGRLIAGYTRAGMMAQTNFIVTADHGMVPAIHTILTTQINQIVTKAGGHPLYIGHGDYCTIWLKNLDSVDQVSRALSQASMANVDAVYARAPNGDYLRVSPVSRLADPAVTKAYGTLLNTFNQAESPDIVLFYDENTITMTPTFLKINRKGDHEGANWGSQHIPLFIAGPGIRKGFVSDYPARLVDIAPTVETLFGIEPQHQDGIALADAMVAPPKALIAAQSRRNLHLLPEVQALHDEAALRPNLRR